MKPKRTEKTFETKIFTLRALRGKILCLLGTLYSLQPSYPSLAGQPGKGTVQ